MVPLFAGVFFTFTHVPPKSSFAAEKVAFPACSSCVACKTNNLLLSVYSTHRYGYLCIFLYVYMYMRMDEEHSCSACPCAAALMGWGVELGWDGVLRRNGVLSWVCSWFQLCSSAFSLFLLPKMLLYTRHTNHVHRHALPAGLGVLRPVVSPGR